MPENGAPVVLAVDLDGTLLRSDMLFESFCAAFAADWRTPFHAAGALRGGRAALKRRLADAAEIDVTLLPYDPKIIAYVERWRAAGGRTALVTASDGALARRIADHLGIFDEAHGSDGTRNLKGREKAAFMDETFGAGGYAYMGDAAADLPIWRGAARAITVNAGAGLRARADALGGAAEHLTTVMPSPRPYLRALRPHQWLKNALVFVPMLAAHRLDGATFAQSLLAFVAFSMIASAVYLLNDLLDLSADRAHPRKRFRPLAAGTLQIMHGCAMAGALFAGGALLSVLAGWVFAGVMAIYVVLTTAYSLALKRRAIIDVAVLAGLYTLRIVAGGAATGIPLSIWLLAFSIFFFFALAAVKRQAELVDSAARGKLGAGGRGYVVEDLPVISMMAISAGYVSVLVMALYVSSPDVAALYSQPMALGGICCVLLYWISRVVMLTHRGRMHDDPVVFAARDRVSQVSLGLIVIFAVIGSVA
ncbi:UbiA family prenyltransferase [Oceaniglobus indicus]|uniref:UbiA family prenyltransferase n=1 Tax=Oceaniglobus indicus TaxID=2047749 RepID=UPI001F4D63AC|nr:UbiA family prenyltransferase [Oceaniglobus indicus]